MRKPALLLPLFLVLSSLEAASMPVPDIVLKAVDYRDGKIALQGWIAYDRAATKRLPGVLLVHEWKGVGDYVKMRAEQVARLGYVAFAVDMYGKGVYAKDHEEAGRLSGAFFQDRAKMRARAKAGYDMMAKDKRVDPARIAAMGYCFGGTTALEMARAGMDLRGAFSFHGNLATPSPAAKGGVKARLVVAFTGADDTWVGDPETFRKEMADAAVDVRLHSYEGAVHSFTVKEAGNDPKTGMAYDAQADRDSWERLAKYLAEVFA